MIIIFVFVIAIILPNKRKLNEVDTNNIDNCQEDIEVKTSKDHIKSLEKWTTNPKEEDGELEFVKSLNKLGIVGATPNLRKTEFNPKQVVEKTEIKLWFMGITGLKWITTDDENDKEYINFTDFDNFLSAIDERGGDVRFLLINPNNKNYLKLKDKHGNTLKQPRFDLFHDLSKKHPCFKVKLYKYVPNFRLIFIDNKILAISNYLFDDASFKTEYGWKAPHLIVHSKLFDKDHEWSLFLSFQKIFCIIWEDSKSLDNFISEQKNSLFYIINLTKDFLYKITNR